MALSEKKVLAEVSLRKADGVIAVRWDNIIERDGVQVSRIPHRKTYNQAQAGEFTSEVDGSEAYLSAMGWGS